MRGRRNRRVSRPASTPDRAGQRSTWEMLIWNHFKLWIAVAVGLVLVFASPSHWGGIARVLVGWNGAILVLVPLTYVWMRKLDAKALRARYVEEDPTAPVIFLFTVIGALLSVLGIIALLKQAHSGDRAVHSTLACLTIVSSWARGHTMFAIRYADKFYSVLAGDQPPLSFPDTAEPLFWDFVYFSFTIGGAWQTGDVSTQQTDIRRIVTSHSLISFVFNLVILGFAINVSAGLMNGS